MDTLTPEIEAIELPPGYEWFILMQDPAIRRTNKRDDGGVAWVNMDCTDPSGDFYRSVNINGSDQLVYYKDTDLTMVDLCRILANYMWMQV